LLGLFCSTLSPSSLGPAGLWLSVEQTNQAARNDRLVIPRLVLTGK
jgi:hypothetical protein